MSKHGLIVIPTYNERENIGEMIETINGVSLPHPVDILVVDSNSPDGTGEFLEKLRETVPNLYVYHQPQKLGLGRAYLDGFKYLETEMKEKKYTAIVTMDADFSHHPRYLPRMLSLLDQYDLVVGSRYIPGGKLENWPTDRKILSRFANFYAKTLTGVPVNDLTSGFHCFRRETLRRVLKFKVLISAEGYAFLIELKFLTANEGFKVAEVPIIFADRTKGTSKISERVIFESAMIPWKCLYDRLFHLNKRAKKMIPSVATKEEFPEAAGKAPSE